MRTALRAHVIEVVGVSEDSVQQAVRNAIIKAPPDDAESRPVRFLCVVGSVEMVSVSNVSVMSCLFTRARLMMLGRFKMMACGMLMVLCCLLVVLCALVSSHLLWSHFANALCVRRIKFPRSEHLNSTNTHRGNCQRRTKTVS